MKTVNGFEYISEVSKIILFGIELKEFGKWTKPELLTFYNDWKQYDTFDEDGVHQLTMESTELEMMKKVGGILFNMVYLDVCNCGECDLSRKDILDYLTTIRREIIINELIN